MTLAKKHLLALSCFALFALVACQDDSNTSCHFRLHVSQRQGQTVECTNLSVLAHRDEVSGSSMTLHVARFFSDPTGPSDQAMLYILGGPGQTWVSQTESISREFMQNLGQDLLLIDQRSVGFNQPKFSCAQSSADPQAELLDYLQTCFDDLSEKGVPLSAYNTWEMAEDIDVAREHFAYDKLDVLGVSYGTKLGLEYLRRHPGHISAMVLDSVSPPQIRAFETDLLANEESIEALFSTCDADASCAQNFPGLEVEFERVFAALEQNSLEVTLSDGRASELDANAFASTVVSSLLSFFPPMAPAFIKEVAASLDASESQVSDDVARVMSLFQVSLDESSGTELLLAVTCAENQGLGQDEIDAQAQELRDAFTAYADLYTDVFVPACSIWPTAPAPENAFEAVQNDDVPVLMLSGAMDPRTPLSWAEQTRSTLGVSTHLIFERFGHSLVSQGNGCIMNFALDFLRSDGSATELDCGPELSPPFFPTLSEALAYLES
ncbi:MAG: alpha/beta fold hydrolase [Myxococcales bacterium]|nr:MAG: alpha/beta fold hydrolase [Myxococcales bacterium]